MENYTTIEQTKKGLSAAQSSITTVKKALDDRITALAEAVASAGGDYLIVDVWRPYDEEASAETDYESEIYRAELSVTPEEIIAASRSGKVVLLRDHYDGATAESPSPKYNPCLYTLVTAFDRWHHNNDKSGNFGYRLIFKEFNNDDYRASIIEANYYDGVSYRELSFVNYGALSINIDTAIAKERESTLRDYFEGAEYAEEGRGKVTFTSPDRKIPWETDPTDSTVFQGTEYGVHMYAWEDLEYENPFTHIDAELTSKTYVAEKIAEAIASAGGSSSGISAFDGNYYSRGYLHDILTRYGSGRGTYWSPDGYGDPDTNGGYQAYYSIDEATTNYSSAPRIISRTNYAGKFPAKIASIYVDEFRDRYVFSFNSTRNGSPATGTGLPTGFHAIDIEWAFEYPKLTKGYKTTGIYTPRQYGIPLKIENSSLSSPSYVTFEDNTYQLFSSQNMAAFLDLSRTGYVAIGVTLFLTKSFSEGSTKGIKDYNIGGFQFEVPKAWLDLGLEDTEGYWS